MEPLVRMLAHVATAGVLQLFPRLEPREYEVEQVIADALRKKIVPLPPMPKRTALDVVKAARKRRAERAAWHRKRKPT